MDQTLQLAPLPRPESPRSQVPSSESPQVEVRPPQSPPWRFESVYAQHIAMVWRSLRLLGVAPGQLEEAAQETFLVVARRLGEVNHRAKLGSWIFAIARKVAANHRRTVRRKSKPLRPLEEAQVPSVLPSPELHMQATQAAAQVAQFCASLEEGHQAVFVLALLEEVPPAEVAEALGIPLNTVYSRIRTLRTGLRDFLLQAGAIGDCNA